MKDTPLHPVRDLAYQWHSGMWSPLYAFASSGIVEDKSALLLEIQANIRDAARKDRHDLVYMSDFIHALPVQENGCYLAPWAKEMTK